MDETDSRALVNQALLNSILELNKFSLDLTCEKFDQAVFDLVHSLVAFDSAIIGSAAFVGAAVVPVGVSLRNLDELFLMKLSQYSYLDDSDKQALSNPGVTLIRLASDADPTFKREVLDHYPVYHSMVTGLCDRRSGVYQGLSINRAEKSPAFTEEERLLKQAFMPHFQEAYAQNRLQRAIDTLDGGIRATYSVISTTLDGTIIATSSAAMNYMVKEFPSWSGGRLPACLLEALTMVKAFDNAKVYASGNLVMKAMKSNDQVLWQLRLPTVVDKLSIRELQVANAYANGLSHKEIAKQFDLSPSTISNQLTSVYSKLEVDNKAALAQLLKD